MLHIALQSVAFFTALLSVAGIGYFCAALVAAQAFLRTRRVKRPAFSPGVSILKSLKGIDPGMMDAFRTHCRQSYTGNYEILFGVSDLNDPAAAAVAQLQSEFPSLAIRLVECPERLGTNGKVSTLVQLLQKARYDFLLINDSDISVSPRYLERIMAGFAPPADESTQKEVGLVTALYRGRAHRSLPSQLEALGIAADFQAGVLLSRLIEGGIHYGLGSTLAVSRKALDKIGGLAQLKDHLADDYELGARISAAGYRVELSSEVVETSIPDYKWSSFVHHQLRWARTVRDSRPWGYVGMIFTHGLAWAILNVLITSVTFPQSSAFAFLSLWLLGASLLARLAMATVVGMKVLHDNQVFAGLWLLPLRDLVQVSIWLAGFAGNTIVWRGDRFVLKNGTLHKAGH
jgi:ceramide glucosyltransferase